MRPVARGDVPGDDNGDPVTYADYKDARDDLIDRMGDYCSYCEVALHSQIDVEHVLPQSLNPAHELNWDNFLLACTSCNSVKGNKAVQLGDFYWPHKDNTLRAFFYELDKPPQIIDDPAVDPDKAQTTLELTGLDRVPGHPKLTVKDRRWKERFQVWSIALLARSNLQSADTPEMREVISVMSQGFGFWSVWLTVFFEDIDMCQRLIAAFSGTAPDCFDDDTNFLPRPGGAL